MLHRTRTGRQKKKFQRGRRRRLATTCLPKLERLEDRLLLAADRLTFGQLPTDELTTDSAIEPALTVEVRDQFHNIISSGNDAVNLSLQENPAGGALQGTTTVTSVDGVATFDDLSIDQSGTDYVLVADAPTLAIPEMGLSIKDIDGEIAVESYSWDVSGSSVGEFELTVDTSTADPGFLAAVAMGTRFEAVSLNVRTPDSERLEYLNYTFTDVAFTAWQTGDNNGQPSDGLLRIDFLKVEQSQRAILNDGTDPDIDPLGPAVVTSYDSATAELVRGDLILPQVENVPEIGLSIADIGTLPVLNYEWGVQNPVEYNYRRPTVVGPLSVAGFQLTIPSSIADPGLLAAVLAEETFETIHLRVEDAGGDPDDVLTYTFTNAVVSQWEIDATRGNSAQGILTLSFDHVQQQWGTMVESDIEVISVGAFDVAPDSETPIDTNIVLPQPNGDEITEMGLTIGDFSGELPVRAYFWDADWDYESFRRGEGTNRTVGSFVLTVDSSTADAGLMEAVALGQRFEDAVLRIRTSDQQPSGSPPVEYLTYTFTDVYLTDWQTNGDAGESTQATLSLDFAVVKQEQMEVQDDGTLGAPVVAQTGYSGRNDYSTGFPSLPQPEDGINVLLRNDDVYLPVTSFSWGVSNSFHFVETNGPLPDEVERNVRQLRLTVDSTHADPALMFNGAGLREGLNVDLILSDGDDQVRTFSFEIAFFTSWQTSALAGETPENVVTLAFDRVFHYSDPYGSAPFSRIDVEKGEGDGEFKLPEQAEVPEIGLSVLGVDGDELEVLGYSWGASREEGAKLPDLGTLELTVPSTIADPGLMLAVFQAQVFEGATLRVRTPEDGFEYLTYELDDVVFTDWQTTAADGDLLPTGTLQLTFSGVRQEQRDMGGLGGTIQSAIAEFDLLDSSKNQGELQIPERASHSHLGLSIGSGGDKRELPVHSFSWGQTKANDQPAPDIGAVTLVVDSGLSDPGFMAAVTQGTIFSEIKLHARVPNNENDLEYLTYTFGDAVFSSYHTQLEAGGEIATHLTLAFDRVKQQWRPVLNHADLGPAIVASFDVELNEGSGGIVPPTRITTIASTEFNVSDPPPTVDLPDGGGTTQLAIEGDQLVVRQNGVVVYEAPSDAPTSITINGTDAGDDQFFVDLSVLSIPSGGIIFNGGDGGNDSIVLAGDANSIAYNPTTPNDGSFLIDGSKLIHFTGLEPATITGSVGDLVVNLPDVVNPDVVLADSNIAGSSQLSASTLEDLTFVNPTNSLTINGGTLADTISLNGLDSSWMADLTIDAQVGANIVNVTGNIALGGDGDLLVRTDRNIHLRAGSSITTVDGNIDLVANAEGTATGDFIGINIDGGTIESTGPGLIELYGHGGDANDHQYGVRVRNGQIIGGTGDRVTVHVVGIAGSGTGTDNYGVAIGTGGVLTSHGGSVVVFGRGGQSPGSGQRNVGVFVAGAGAEVTSGGDGRVDVFGVGGSGTGNNLHGVQVDFGGKVTSGGNGRVLVEGFGGSGAGFSNGVVVGRFGGHGQVSSGGGDVYINGQGGSENGSNGANNGVLVFGSGAMVITSGDLNISGYGARGDGPVNFGVRIGHDAQVYSGNALNVLGRSGIGDGDNNRGVQIDNGAIVTSLLGPVRVEGFGWFGNGFDNTGVLVLDAEITSGGTITVQGDGPSDGVRIQRGAIRSDSKIWLDGYSLETSVAVIDGSRVESSVGNIFVNGQSDIVVTGLEAPSGTVSLFSSSGQIRQAESGTDITAGQTASFLSELAPSGPGVAGQMVVDGDARFDDQGALTVDLNGTTAELEHDQLKILGPGRVLELNGTPLNIDLNFTPSAGDQFVIVDNVDPTLRANGTFAGLSNGDALVIDDQVFHLFYEGGEDNNDIVLIANRSPTIPTDRDLSGNRLPEGSPNGTPVGIAAVSSDPDGDLVMYTLTDDAGGRYQIDGSTGVITVADQSRLDDGIHTVMVQASDSFGAASSASFDIEITNVDPVITSITTTAPLTQPAADGEAVTLMLTFDDPGSLDTHTVVIDWDDATAPEIIVLPSVQRTLAVDHIFQHQGKNTGGIFNISVTVADDDGGKDAAGAVAAATGARLTEDGQLQIVGTAGNDSIRVNRNGRRLSVRSKTLGRISDLSTSSVSQIVVSAGDGDDVVRVGSNVNIPTFIFGGAGNDRLVAGRGSAVLVGGDGDDTLLGGSGNDVLVGGRGTDRIRGGSGGDILIAGYTRVDQDLSILDAVLAEWNSDNSYKVRDTNLSFFYANILDDEKSIDRLQGERGRDRFFVNLNDDRLVQRNFNEFLN